MNIDDIRAEIPKAFTDSWLDTIEWIKNNGSPEYQNDNSATKDDQTAARILIDWAYEAGIIKGLADGAAWANETNQAASVFYDYKRGYNDAAKNPKAWWVPDKNGGAVHICEYVKVDDCDVPMRVIGFSQDENGNMKFVDCEGFQISADECEKIIPDTRDKIKEELAESFIWDGEDITEKDVALKLAEKFISRIEALEYGGKYDLW